MKNLLACHQLDIRVGDRVLLDALDLDIQANQCWAILGPNGVGKTQLLRHLSGLQKTMPADAIQLLGQPLPAYPARRRAELIGLVLQHSQTGFQHTALDMVLSGHYPHQIDRFWDSPQTLHQALQALAAVGLEAQAGQPLEQLSGGELRRVEIARLLMQNPHIALLDEPLNHLDVNQQMHILALLKTHFANPQRALILVLHDLNLARQIASHCLLLFADSTWQAGPVGQVASRENLARLIGYPLNEYQVAGNSVLMPDTPETLSCTVR